MGQWKVDCIGRKRHKRQMMRRANLVYYYRTNVSNDGKQVMLYTAGPKRKRSLAIPMKMIKPGETANEYKISWLDVLGKKYNI